MSGQRFLTAPKPILVVFALLFFGICAAVLFYYLNERKRVFRIQSQNLRSIADLKIRQISTWRQERIADGEAILANEFIGRAASEFLQSPGKKQNRAALLVWMKALQAHYGYQGIFFLNSEGKVALSLADQAADISPHVLELIPLAINNKLVVLSDLARAPNSRLIHMDVLAPILASSTEGNSKAVGILLLRIDPRRFLYPLIQSWPVPSRTAESLLVRLEKGSVLFLNELRHNQGTALALRIPVSQTETPAVQAASLKKEGTVRGRDYRGIPVLAAVGHIPKSDWYLVAKMDESEAYKPMVRQTVLLAAMVAAMLLVAATIAALLWKRHSERFYQAHRETELDFQALERQYRFLTRFASDAILLLNREGHILDSNEKASELYGYAREELAQMALTDLQPTLTTMGLMQMLRRAKEQNHGFACETAHRGRQSNRIPVELSIHSVDVDGSLLYQAIVRDASERKKAEAAMHESRALFTALLRETPAAVLVLRVEDLIVLEVNKAFESMAGRARQQVVAKSALDLGLFPDEKTLEEINSILQGRQYISAMEFLLQDKSGKAHKVFLSIAPVVFDGENALLVVMADAASSQTEATEKSAI